MRQESRWCSGARGRGRPAGVGLLALLLLVGCATLSRDSSPESKRIAVTERAKARWAAILRGDLDAAYGFLSPASREVLSLAAFKARPKAGAYRDMQVDGVECQAEICKVGILLTYDHRMMKGVTTPVTETWLLEEGQFWYVWQF